MDEEFDSLIVTDPDLVDPGIDVSGLRTQTDTSLLGNIPDFAGIQYEAFNPNRLSDLMRLYSTGLPAIDTAQPATPPSSGGGSGGGGQAITPTNSITDGTNINTPGGLTQSGTFGGQPTFTTTPGTTVDDVTGNITNPDGSYGGNINDEVALTGGTISPTTPPIDPTGRLPQTSESRFAATGTLSDPREKQDFITEEDAADPGFLDKIGLGQFNLGEALVKTAINTAIGKPVTFLLDFLKNNLPPQDPRQTELNKLYDVQDGTIQSGLMKGYNPVSGGFPGISEPTFGLQEAYQDRIDTIENTLADKYGMTAAEIADVKAGSYTGDVDTDLLDRLNQLETDKAKEKSRLDLFSGDIQETGDASIAEQIAEADRLGISGDIGVEGEDADRFSTPTTSITDGTNITTDITSDQINEFGTAPATGVTRPETVLGKTGIDRFDDAETSIDMFDTTPIDEFSDEEFMVGDTSIAAATGSGSGADSFFDAVDRSVTGTTKPGTPSQNIVDEVALTGGGGGSDSSSGGKSIVCTAMYQTTGLEDWSKAMKIWYIYQKKYLTIQHQDGYHKLFKPFVKGMHKNNLIKIIGAHVAKHRTQHLKHVMFNSKPSLLGKIYNKILEPICYWVGKYAK